MSRYQFDISNPDDDPSLCELLRATPMEGQMRIAFCRQPSFFDAAVVEGDKHQTIVCRDQQQQGRVVAMGTCSRQRRWVNDHPQEIGYLSGLRIHPDHRSLGIMARGFQLMRQLQERDPLPLYLTTIAAGNDQAWRLLSSGRAGLPTYHEAGNYLTFAIPLSRRRHSPAIPRRCGKFDLRLAEPSDIPAIIEFWNQNGRRRQFFPAYDAGALDPKTGRLRELQTSDLLIAWSQDRIVGTLGAWDQLAFRRSIVHGYGPVLSQLRPLVNAWAGIRGRSGLPTCGESLRILFAAVPLIQDDDPDCFRLILETCLKLNSGRGFSHLVLGVSQRDPLLAILKRYSNTIYRTRLCYVQWDPKASLHRTLDDRPPYLEVGCL